MTFLSNGGSISGRLFADSDANAPTDQGGDIITNDADLIFGNGGNATNNGAACATLWG